MGLDKFDCKSQNSDSEITESSLKFEWLSTEEAASFLRISVKSLRNLTSNGKIPYYKFFNLNRYRKDELQKLLLAQKRGGLYGN